MRVYIPATSRDLTEPALGARRAHAVTKELEEALGEEDRDGLEAVALLCAADSSLRLLSSPKAIGAADRRVVVAAEVADDAVRVVAPVSDEVLPGTVDLAHAVPWERVAALFVDDGDAQQAVRQAREGDDEAFEEAAQADLLWYDVTEREALAALLS